MQIVTYLSDVPKLKLSPFIGQNSGKGGKSASSASSKKAARDRITADEFLDQEADDCCGYDEFEGDDDGDAAKGGLKRQECKLSGNTPNPHGSSYSTLDVHELLKTL